jgi:hypothetical protein
VARDLYSFPRRIRENLEKQSLYQEGKLISSRIVRQNTANLDEENSFLLAYKTNMETLDREHRWIGAADYQICLQSFLSGAKWAKSIFGTEKHE